MTTNLANPNWTNLGGLNNVTSFSIVASNPAAHYRILGQQTQMAACEKPSPN